MIRVSTRGRYALRAMLDVALHAGEGPVSRRGIAERQAISPDYLAHLFAQLGRAGLVESVKGPGGGYRLCRDATEISAGDVVRAVEGPVAIVHCTIPSDDPKCDRVAECATHLLWKRLSGVMSDYLDSVTLQDICEEALLLTTPRLNTAGGGAGGKPLCK